MPPLDSPPSCAMQRAARDERRGGSVEPGPRAREVVLMPEHLALCGIHAREDAADADGDDLAFGYCGRASWPGVPRGRAGHRLGGIFLLPKLLAVDGVQAADDFVVTLTHKDVEFVADQGRGSVNGKEL